MGPQLTQLDPLMPLCCWVWGALHPCKPGPSPRWPAYSPMDIAPWLELQDFRKQRQREPHPWTVARWGGRSLPRSYTLREGPGVLSRIPSSSCVTHVHGFSCSASYVLMCSFQGLIVPHSTGHNTL